MVAGAMHPDMARDCPIIHLLTESDAPFFWANLPKEVLPKSCQYKVQHGRDLETWHLEAGRALETSDADTEVGVLWTLDLEVVDF